MSSAFVRAYPPALAEPGPALWLPFRDGEVLLPEGQTRLFRGESDAIAALGLAAPLYLGTLDGVPCLADDVPSESELPQGWHPTSLRALFDQLDAEEYALAGYAAQVLYWRRTSGFCPVCGHATEERAGDWGRKCPHCGHVTYPHVSPAVLILIYDGPRLLLAHKPGWGPRYSILAGFTEPGESLEDCVRRETREEVGLELTDLAYVGSQPWPYPHQLMVGFNARYAGGEIRVDAEELDDAKWFSVDALPDLPPAVSLSRQMIDAWIAGQKTTP